MTPGGSSRPGSAMSTSTTTSGVVYRRSTIGSRKPRPSSIAGTGMTPDSKFYSNRHTTEDFLFVITVLIIFVWCLVADLAKQQKKDRPPSRPSSAVRRSSSTNITNGANGSASQSKMSQSMHETPKRSVKSAPPKKVRVIYEVIHFK